MPICKRAASATSALALSPSANSGRPTFRAATRRGAGAAPGSSAARRRSRAHFGVVAEERQIRMHDGDDIGPRPALARQALEESVVTSVLHERLNRSPRRATSCTIQVHAARGHFARGRACN